VVTQVLDQAVDVGTNAKGAIPVLDALPSQAVEQHQTSVWRVLAVVCVAAAMNLVFFPRAVLDRLSDLEPGPVVDVLVASAESLAAVSDRTGLPAVFEGLREGFLEKVAK